MNVEDINVDNVFLDENTYENILVYNILYKTFMDAKPLRNRFDKVDELIKIYNGNVKTSSYLIEKKKDYKNYFKVISGNAKILTEWETALN